MAKKATQKEIIDESFAVTSYQDIWDWSARYKRVSNDPVTDLETDLPLWRNRSQFLHQSTDIVKASTQNVSVEIIGKGLFCSPQINIGDISKNRTTIQAIKDVWEEWEDACHINGQADLPSVLRSVTAAILRDGDVLAYITTNDSNQLKIDLIAADRIASPPKDQIPKGSDVYMGVQVKKRFIEGYWVKNTFDAKGFTFFPTFEDGQIVSVLLQNPNNTDRINSYRGTPALAASLGTIDQLEKLLKAEIQAATLKTNQYGILTTKTVPSQMMKGQSDVYGSVQATKAGGTNILVVKAGDELIMSRGVDISNPYLKDTVKIYYQKIASNYNIPYNIIFNMMEDSSYSTNMTLRQEAWEATEVWRKYYVRNLLTPIYKMILEKAIAEKKIPNIPVYSAKIAKVQFNGQSNASIRPKDLIEAQKMAIESNQKSIVDVCNENGMDAYQILYENMTYFAAKKALMQEFGLNLEDTIEPEEGKLKISEEAK